MKNQELNTKEAEKIYREFQKKLAILMSEYFEELKKVHQKVAEKKVQSILKKLK